MTFLKKDGVANFDEEEFAEFTEKFNPKVLKIFQTFFDTYYRAIGI